MPFFQQPQPDPEQQQPQYQGTPFELSPYANLQSDTATANLVQQINPEVFVEQIEHFLRGEVYEAKEQIWAKKYDAYMNEKGFSRVMPRVRATVTQLNTMVNYQPDEISKLMIKLSEDIVPLFRREWKNFQIEKANLPIITGIIMDMCYATLKRGDKIFLQKAHTSHEQVIQHNMQKQGMMSNLSRKIPGFFRS